MEIEPKNKESQQGQAEFFLEEDTPEEKNNACVEKEIPIEEIWDSMPITSIVFGLEMLEEQKKKQTQN
ncbi:MAG: hypothetical protein HUU50_12000 [Candidatus Brocadiae bacterium]|nr:hypothetical protein [Candidatus Brocadiia bacterium]